jgi:ribulose 1,5-bisphosphate synthetase/thiazole synthase
MALFSRSGRSTSVNNFILRQTRGAMQAVPEDKLRQGLQTINENLRVAGIESLNVDFTDEMGKRIGRRTFGGTVSGRTSMFTATHQTLQAGRNRKI